MSLVTFSCPKSGDSIPATDGTDRTIIDKMYSIDGYFTENAGQVDDEQVRFYSSGGMQVGFADSAVLLKLVEQNKARPIDASEEMTKGPHIRQDNIPLERGVMVRITFDGSNKVTPRGVQEMPHHNNYFIGNDPAKWRTGVRNYREIVYENLYRGIDLRYRASPKGTKYEFVVHPGADPSVIRMNYEGIESIQSDHDGIVLRTALGDVRDTAPRSIDKAGNEVRCGFALQGTASYGFECSDWDGHIDMVIDPLVYSTFLGADGHEYARSIAVDHAGSAYLAGMASSNDFPTTPGAFDGTYNNGPCAPGDICSDVFVTKLTPAGDGLEYSTFLGGEDNDTIRSIKVDSDGNAFVSGGTSSRNFPVTTGAFDTSLDGPTDGFVTKLNPTGSGLVYSTFIGGKAGVHGYGDDYVRSMALDTSGNAYLVGGTGSPDFPVTPGAYDTTFRPLFDTFVAKLNSTGSALIYSTFFGGNAGLSTIESIAVDLSGIAYLVGVTFSTDFPVTPGAFDTTFNGDPHEGDVFISKFNAAGSTLEYSTFLGGGMWEWATQIRIDSSNCAYVAGSTISSDFPTTPGAFASAKGGAIEGFVTKLNAAGNALVYSTFLGGIRSEDIYSIAVDTGDEAYLAGTTTSPDFPITKDAFDITLNDFDAFVTKLDASGASLVYSTFLGGWKHDHAFAVELDTSGNAYVAGHTWSYDFPTTPGAFDTVFNGSYIDGYYNADVFATKLGLGTEANSPPVADARGPYSGSEGVSITFKGDNSYDPDGDALSFRWDFDNDGTADTSWSSSPTATNTWSDDYAGEVRVEVSDGKTTSNATAAVTILNLPPTIDSVHIPAIIATAMLRIAGEKWHDVSAHMVDGVNETLLARLVREPGRPQETSFRASIDVTKINALRIVYTPDDDPVNGQPNGATPAWLTFVFDSGPPVEMHHTFNVKHEDTWNWTVSLSSLLAERDIAFTVTAIDPGSDDLMFTWDWGDGSPATAKTHYNDGIGPDPYPSSGGTFPFTATDSQRHAYSMAGTYSVVLRVTDDDGGMREVLLVMVIV